MVTINLPHLADKICPQFFLAPSATGGAFIAIGMNTLGKLARLHYGIYVPEPNYVLNFIS